MCAKLAGRHVSDWLENNDLLLRHTSDLACKKELPVHSDTQSNHEEQ